ncbi:MAG: hypothetical protein B6D62_04655 [Candidatus Cloacimonas sp. 4484_275]|nr:MAG: hypothetical protein B6D62_04655 [Candidatus Cloacimonas sp. 4484_275]
MNKAFLNLQFDKILSSLEYKTKTDSLIAADLTSKFRQSLATTELLQKEAKTYSAAIIFSLMVVSIIIFIVIFYQITKPLKELQQATSKIKEGEFSVNLPETGIKEIKELKQSFNSMSRELANIQTKLLEAEKENIWKQFSRILAHEIKNPLTPIQLSIQRLEDKFGTKKFDDIFPEAVQIINQEIRHLYNLAQNFSNFAKNTKPEFSVFNPFAEIRSIAKSYSHKYDIKITGLKKCLIEFDKTHFYQVITNLLQNAIDASPPEKPITINLKEKNNKIIIAIIDFGSGIASEDLKRIFEPYFSKKKKGIGLGLALVKKLTEINNAEINVRSEIGVGTTFELMMECPNESVDY